MKSSKILLSLAICSLISGCNNDVDCAEQQGENFAVEILLGNDEECAYEGTVEIEESGETSDMVCSYSDEKCACRGGSEFALYRVNITDTKTNQTDTAVIDVTSAGSPICVVRDVVESFTPVDGAGGAGGAPADD